MFTGCGERAESKASVRNTSPRLGILVPFRVLRFILSQKGFPMILGSEGLSVCLERRKINSDSSL